MGTERGTPGTIPLFRFRRRERGAEERIQQPRRRGQRDTCPAAVCAVRAASQEGDAGAGAVFGQHRGVDCLWRVFLGDGGGVDGEVVLPVQREAGRGVWAWGDGGRVGVAVRDGLV